MHLRIRAVATAIVVATVGAIAIPAAPASANVSQGYVAGSGTWTDDWNDEGPISASTRSYNNVVAMWQKILVADGYLAASGVDCRFGAVTTAATRRWQSDRGLVSDGVVGPKTLARAATRLSTYEGDSWFYYDGLGSNFIYFGRLANGTWDMSLGVDLEWRPLSYTAATFGVCS
ncbi:MULTISPECIES: peptidoglycan-binding domain-containing protein [Micromonospora]|uniref:peptidoglycan-binding domain-containing protein n=1 Tax=Micromonospora TaxID=1873 RepID=UPI001EE8D607|nr:MULTISPECIES: peptidoglycan-binding domain-containing protein [Micromonospora]MCG5448271.1 peptidoglycan-binding protein [Micromonospora hortensis]MCX5117450.1 peptidoglycan-binding protein [Micromonospora sp. NBC_00362]WTI10463.1 peptidoglycan-binding protein [Micromonospora sp. NBC_00821]